jgi:hypothetical protein
MHNVAAENSQEPIPVKSIENRPGLTAGENDVVANRAKYSSVIGSCTDFLRTDSNFWRI